VAPDHAVLRGTRIGIGGHGRAAPARAMLLRAARCQGSDLPAGAARVTPGRSPRYPPVAPGKPARAQASWEDRKNSLDGRRHSRIVAARPASHSSSTRISPSAVADRVSAV